MGLFAQVGGAGHARRSGGSASWSIALIGLAGHPAGRCRAAGVRDVDDTPNRVAAIVLYALIAVVGLAPGDRQARSTSDRIQVEAILLILLVLLGHGLVVAIHDGHRLRDERGSAKPGEHDQARSCTRREIGGRFGEVVAGVRADQWDNPSPVDGWAARDVVRHLVEWFPSFLAARRRTCSSPPARRSDDDPAGAWDHLQREVQAILDDPASEDRVLSNRHIGVGTAARGGLQVLHRRRLHAHLGPGARHRPGRHPRPARSAPRCSRGWSRSRSSCAAAGSTARGSTYRTTRTCRPGCWDSSAAIPSGNPRRLPSLCM